MNEQTNGASAQAPVNGAQVDLTKRPVEVPQTTENKDKAVGQPSDSSVKA